MNSLELKKILLLSVPFSAKSLSSGPKMENQGLCYLKGYLKYNNFYVDMIDGNAAESPWYEVINQIEFEQYFLIGFSVYSTNYQDTISIIKAIRSSGYTGHITLGGHYPTFSWELILTKNPGIDSIVLGEGERPLLELARALKASLEWCNIPGIAYRNNDNNSPVFNHLYPLLDPLEFPFIPDRTSYGNLLTRQNFATISSSRGCRGNCNFCSVRTFYKLGHGTCWRPRSAEEIVKEMSYLNKNMAISNFAFCDDNFIGTGKIGLNRARQIGEEILRQNLDIAYAIDCRPDDVEDELFTFLCKTGLVKVNIGVESFLERQQNLYSKSLSMDSIEKALTILKKLDLLIAIYTILFDPFVTFDELLVNFERARQIGAESFPEFATFLQVFPGIPLYNQLKDGNILNNHMILKTDVNKYWLNYNFQNPGIEEFFIMCLEFEINLDKILSPFTKLCGIIPPEIYYNLYSSLRKLACECFMDGIIKLRDISTDNLKNFIEEHLAEWINKAKKIGSDYKEWL